MKKRAVALTTAVLTGGLLAATPAPANTVTVGSPGPTFTMAASLGGPYTLANTAIPGGTATAPGNGVITSWKIIAGGGPFTLQVVHPVGGGAFTSTGDSAPGTITTPGATVTFQTNLAIAKGDYVGVKNSSSSGDAIGFSAPPGSSFMGFLPPLGSSPQTSGGSEPAELAYNAQVLLNCVVPKLKGKKVGAAKAALAAAGCAEPTVKKGKRKGKFVRKQNPAAGTEIRGDAAVTLKKGPKPKKK